MLDFSPSPCGRGGEGAPPAHHRPVYPTPHSRHPECIATIPPDRLRTDTRPNPAVLIMSAKVSWSGTSGCFRPDNDSSPRRVRYGARASAARGMTRHRRVAAAPPPEPGRTPGRDRPPGLRYAARLSEHRRLVGAVAQTERDRHAVNQPIRQRQVFGVSDQQRRLRDEPARQGTIARDLQHRRVDVAQQQRTAALLQPREADVAGPARKVQQHAPRAGIQRRHQHAFPRTMDAQRHQVVHQVVAWCNAVEYRAHHAALAPRGTLLKPKSVVLADPGLSLM